MAVGRPVVGCPSRAPSFSPQKINTRAHPSHAPTHDHPTVKRQRWHWRALPRHSHRPAPHSLHGHRRRRRLQHRGAEGARARTHMRVTAPQDRATRTGERQRAVPATATSAAAPADEVSAATEREVHRACSTAVAGNWRGCAAVATTVGVVLPQTRPPLPRASPIQLPPRLLLVLLLLLLMRLPVLVLVLQLLAVAACHPPAQHGDGEQ